MSYHNVRKPKESTKTEFKNVYFYNISANGRTVVRRYNYKITISRTVYECFGFESARDAALALDKKLIDLGREPINVLKRKTEMV